MTKLPLAPNRHRLVAGLAIGAVFAMLGMSFAAVPLYRIFCSATGYGGTTQRAEVAPTLRGERTLKVRFDSNVAPGLPWSFSPDTPEISLLTGETATVFFKVTNQTDRPTTAQAMFNVGPDVAGAYFNKIACFCFNEQTLAPHETLDMPVVFFLDPALEKDASMNGVSTIVLSYTFFPVKPTVASASAAKQL